MSNDKVGIQSYYSSISSSGTQYPIHVKKLINGQEIQNWKQRNWGFLLAFNELGQPTTETPINPLFYDTG